MVDRKLSFDYRINIIEIYNIIIEDNNSFINEIDDIKEYNKGEWNKCKRKDNILFDIKDIPEELNKYDELINIKEVVGMRGTIIPLKIKYRKLVDNEDKKEMKIKIKMRSLIASIILKVIKIRVYLSIKRIDNKNTKIDVRYRINTLLPKKLNDKINDIVINKIENELVIKIDNYLRGIEINRNNE